MLTHMFHGTCARSPVGSSLPRSPGDGSGTHPGHPGDAASTAARGDDGPGWRGETMRR